MRTTVRLDEALLTAAKAEALRSGTTLRALIEESLRERLNRSGGKSKPQTPVRLHTAGSGGTLPGVDLDDGAALADLMNE